MKEGVKCFKKFSVKHSEVHLRFFRIANQLFYIRIKKCLKHKKYLILKEKKNIILKKLNKTNFNVGI
ncbi:hypothetical protein FUSO4_00905 [Fusobacterium necrophorum DJ-1]|nr:hypothetical protein FUSO4_00905 [Fusobacterium necrophorum DJ-1]KDE71708.1 hypothetical protein FUSO8_07755 [Fusobacterium necrophorum DJ-2]